MQQHYHHDDDDHHHGHHVDDHHHGHHGHDHHAVKTDGDFTNKSCCQIYKSGDIDERCWSTHRVMAFNAAEIAGGLPAESELHLDTDRWVKITSDQLSNSNQISKSVSVNL